MRKKKTEVVATEERKTPGRNGSWEETDFSIKVKKKLIDKRMNQKQLAEILGVTPGYICQNIYGQKNDEALKMRICEVLGIKGGRKKAVGE